MRKSQTYGSSVKFNTHIDRILGWFGCDCQFLKGFHFLINSGVGVFFSRQDAGLLPAKQEPTPCFAFLGGNSPLPIRSTGAIILS
jgi:hypothetical protein